MSIKSYLEELKTKTPLELIEELRLDISNEALLFSDYKLDIIESTLNLYEARIKFLEEEQKENAKKLKAIDIIKKKRVDTATLYLCLEEYNISYYNITVNPTKGESPLTPKDWDILKEVLFINNKGVIKC